MRGLRADGVDRLVLDLGQLTFLDSTGIRLVLVWVRAAEREGFELAFGRGGDAVMRVFELTGLDDWLPWTEEATR